MRHLDDLPEEAQKQEKYPKRDCKQYISDLLSMFGQSAELVKETLLSQKRNYAEGFNI